MTKVNFKMPAKVNGMVGGAWLELPLRANLSSGKCIQMNVMDIGEPTLLRRKGEGRTADAARTAIQWQKAAASQACQELNTCT